MADLPESVQWITQKQLVDLCGNYDAVRKRLQRDSAIDRTYVTTDRGRELRISVESLLAHGWITTNQFDALTGRTPTVSNCPNDGETLLLNSAILKKLTDLSETEVSTLDKYVPTWSTLSINKIVHKCSAITGKHRTWFVRDHRIDKRTERESILDKITPEQEISLKRRIISIRMKKNFVDECLADPDLPKMSARTWYRIAVELQKEMHDEIELTQRGEIILRQQTEPILRDKTYLKPLEVIVGDYWRVDRITRWMDGSLARPALSAWVDFRSNKIVGSALAKNPNSLGVKTSLFEVFIRYGIPFAAYMDNGKEYKAHRIAGLKDEEPARPMEWMNEIDNDLKIFEHKGILPALQIKDMRAIVRNARAKPIERIFGRGSFTDRAKEFSDWSGSKYWQMPEVVKKAMIAAKHGETYVDKITGETLEFCDIRELVASMTEFIEFHNNRPSRGFGMDGKSPNEIFAELSAVNPPRKADVYEIAFAFMESPKNMKKIRATGHIEYKKDMFYRADELWRHRNEYVHIRYNPIVGHWWIRADKQQAEYLPNVLYVFDEKGKFICEALPVERMHPTEAEISEPMARQRKTLAAAKRSVRELTNSKEKIEFQVVDVKNLPDEAMREMLDEQKMIDEEKEETKKRNNPYFKSAYIP